MPEIRIPVFISTRQERRANAVLDHADQHGVCHVLGSSVPSSHRFSEEVQPTSSSRDHVETLRGNWVRFRIPGSSIHQSANIKATMVCSVDPVETTDHFSWYNGAAISIKYWQISIWVNTEVMHLLVCARVLLYPISCLILTFIFMSDILISPSMSFH